MRSHRHRAKMPFVLPILHPASWTRWPGRDVPCGHWASTGPVTGTSPANRNTRKRAAARESHPSGISGRGCADRQSLTGGKDQRVAETRLLSAQGRAHRISSVISCGVPFPFKLAHEIDGYREAGLSVPVAECGVLTGCHVRDITSPLSYAPASAENGYWAKRPETSPL